MGFEVPITIDKVIQGIHSRRYVLPAIQREFVWDANQIEGLFDSIMRGYPIGSFLFWKIHPDKLGDFQFYSFMDHYHERDFRHNQPTAIVSGSDTTAVLDGQQRLTSLYIGMNGWYADKLPYYRWWNNEAFPRRYLYLNLLREPNENIDKAYDFRMLQEKDAKNQPDKAFWFRVGDISKFKDVPDVFEFCVEQGLTVGKIRHPSQTLIRLFQRIKQDNLINYFLEEEQNLDKVLNIFIRVNSGGTPLSYSDMLLSIATAQWKEKDAREEIYGLADRLADSGNGFNISKDFILKAGLVLTDVNAIEFRVNNFNRENMLKIESAWDELVRALTLTSHLLKSWGYNWQTLVSTYAMIPLAYYIHKRGSPANFTTNDDFKEDRSKMLQWLRAALLKRIFGGNPDNVLRTIRRGLQKGTNGFPLEAISTELTGIARPLEFTLNELDNLMDYQYGQSYTFSVLSMLYPWLKYDQVFHLDHIFPQAMFSAKELLKRGIPVEEHHVWFANENTLANLQLLQGAKNESKSDKEFESWLQGECPTPQDLAMYRDLHMIPDVDLSFEKFHQFVEAREKLLRTRLAELLRVDLTVKEEA